MIFNIGFTLFPDEDFKNAYDYVCSFKNTKSLEIKDLKYFLTKVFGFPPLDEELATFKDAANKQDNDSITFEEILEALYNIRQYLQDLSQRSQTFTSYQKYYDDMYKHK